MDRHTVARYWSEGADPPDRRSERESAFERVRDIAAEKAALPGMTKRAVYEFLLHMHNDPPLMWQHLLEQIYERIRPASLNSTGLM